MAWYRTSGGGVPASLKNDMNAVLNKKFSTETVYPPETWANNVNLLGKLPEATKSGTVVHFADGADGVPIKNLVANIAPTLEGVDEVTVTRMGKNILDLFRYSNPLPYTYRGITYTRNSDGSVHAEGTATDTAYWNVTFTAFYNAMPAEKYIGKNIKFTVTKLRGTGSIVAGTTSYFRNDGTYQVHDLQPVPDDASSFRCFVSVSRGSTVDMDFVVQMEIGTTTTAYEPYEETSDTVELGRTVYGGTVDVVSGEGEETYDSIDLGEQTYFKVGSGMGEGFYGYYLALANIGDGMKPRERYTPNTMIVDGFEACNASVWFFNQMTNKTVMNNDTRLYFCIDQDLTVAEFKILMDGVLMSYERATPTDFSVEPITPTPETKLGTNTIWNDAGDSSVTYRRDIELALSAGAPLMMMTPRPPIQEQPQEEEESTDESI